MPCPATYNDTDVTITGKEVEKNSLFFGLNNGMLVDAFKVHPQGNSKEAKFNRKLLADYKKWVLFIRGLS